MSQAYYWSLERIAHGIDECKKISESISEILHSELNCYHGINWSNEQYQKLLGNWPTLFIHTLYDRWHNPNRCLSDQGQKTQMWLPSDFDDFSSVHSSDSVNAQIVGELHAIKNNNRHFCELPDFIETLQYFKSFIFAKSPILINDPYFIHQSKWVRRLRLFICLIGLFPHASGLFFYNQKRVSVKIDKAWRTKVKSADGMTFYDACEMMLRRYIPVVFLEGFAMLRQCAKNKQYHALYTANALNYSVPFCFIIASNPKIKLLCHQHGGCYGMDLKHLPEDYERRVSDVYYTWGWDEGENTKALTIPPRIKPANVHKRRKVLIKCGHCPKYVHRIQFNPMGEMNNVMIAQTIDFVKAVKHMDVEIAYYPAEHGYSLRDYLKREGVVLAEKSQEDGKYAIHVCNYLASSWLETLAANLPTICFYDAKAYAFRTSAKRHVDALERVGILHHSPESAAEKLIAIRERTQDWWESDEVQKARMSFVDQYARLNKDWLKHWKKEFQHFALSL